ncbi:MAG: ABC transporter ATP-binding protein [Solirubrobacteraceae bacterium]
MPGDVPALELRGITKRFGSLVANDAIDFELRRGEIHALLGENGAGKSTLMNVLYGLHQPDEGEILLDGSKVEIHSPRQAMNLGIGMVHQHFMLVPVMTVAENLVLGAEPRNGPLLDYKTAARRTRELSERFGLAVDPDTRVENLGVGAQQRVEILRALFGGAKVLVLDEPTAVLTAQESQDLFRVLRALQQDGTSIVFISHKLNEVLGISDRVTVLRRGEKIDTVETEGSTERSLARLMVGREVLLRVEKPEHKVGEPLLQVEGVSALDDRELPAVNDVSFEVRAGEIVAIAGVDANGQSELIEVLTGLRKPTAGTVTVEGRDVTGASPRDVQDAGVGCIAEDRHRRGLVLDFSLAENVFLREYRRKGNSRFGLLSPRRMAERAGPMLKDFDVRGGDSDTRAASLSGGNQQKVVIAREMSREHRVLIAANPTQGVDVGATEYVHQRLLEDRSEGKAVVLVSIDLDELLKLSDRIIVLFRGKVAYQAARNECTVDDIALAMAGTPGRGAEITEEEAAEPAAAAEAT